MHVICQRCRGKSEDRKPVGDFSVDGGHHLQHMWPSQAVFGDLKAKAVVLPGDHWLFKRETRYHQVPGSLGGK